MLPAMYSWLAKEGAPKMLVEALKFYGVQETPGPANNPVIMGWAKELQLDYEGDSEAWCGLFMSIVATRAGKTIPMTGYNRLRALQWVNFGTPVQTAMLGDVLVFSRTGGGHVSLYVGEDDTCYHILGGNQSDMVNIIRYPKAHLFAIRRPIYSIAQPPNVRVIKLNAQGEVVLKVS